MYVGFAFVPPVCTQSDSLNFVFFSNVPALPVPPVTVPVVRMSPSFVAPLPLHLLTLGPAFSWSTSVEVPVLFHVILTVIFARFL